MSRLNRRLIVFLMVSVSLSESVVQAADPQKKEVPKPLPKEIVQAWEKAGAEVGWSDVGVFGKIAFYSTNKAPEADWLPALRISPRMLKGLPAPEAAFALHLFTGGALGEVTDAEMKLLADFKRLSWLYINNARATDAGLKELANLKQLAAIDVTFSPVTDAHLKEFAKLQQLNTLNLAFSKVTNNVLKELANFKQLSVLSLSGTKVTDGGMKELAKLKQLTSLILFDT